MLDSGCIQYVTSNLSNFTKDIAYRKLFIAMLADKQSTTIAVIDLGKIKGYTFINRKPMWLILKNVPFSPTITNRILSTSCLNQKGFRIAYFNSEAYIIK